MRTLKDFRAVQLALAVFVCCVVTACGGNRDEAPEYWDQSEVDEVCGAYGATLEMCGGGGADAVEFADTCKESISVDNPQEDAACHQAIVQRYACMGALSCTELSEHVDGVGGADEYPCRSELEAVGQSC